MVNAFTTRGSVTEKEIVRMVKTNQQPCVNRELAVRSRWLVRMGNALPRFRSVTGIMIAEITPMKLIAVSIDNQSNFVGGNETGNGDIVKAF